MRHDDDSMTTARRPNTIVVMPHPLPTIDHRPFGAH